jgi:hypothetical protein
MDKILELIYTALSALGIETAGQPWVGYATATFTAASETASKQIQLPKNGRGWKIIGMFSVATAMDFYADISRSKNNEHLTSGSTPADLCLTDPADTAGKSLIPPWEGDDNETVTFALTHGATASNVVKICVIARRK